MKKWRNLFDKITDLDNIILAHNKARKNKTSRADVRMVDKDVVGYCKQIQQMLINETLERILNKALSKRIIN